MQSPCPSSPTAGLVRTHHEAPVGNIGCKSGFENSLPCCKHRAVDVSSEGAPMRRVVVDGGTRIPAGLEVGYDVEHDRVRFHVTQNGVTRITPSMLGQ